MVMRHHPITRIVFAVVLVSVTCLALIRTSEASWTVNGVPVSNAPLTQGNAAMIPDGTGGMFVAWEDYRAGNTNAIGDPLADIYAQHLNANGAPLWTANGTVVYADTLSQTNPSITTDGAGGVIVAWLDWRPGSLYAQRLDANGVPQWTAGGVNVTNGTGGVSRSIMSDGASGAFIAWGGNDIYGQHLDASGARLWTPNGAPICVAASVQAVSSMTGDGAGGFVVCWEDSRSSATSDIYAQRITPAGSPSWTVNGIPICTAPNSQLAPQIASDGNHGAVISWQDFRISNAHVYAQRINGAGTTLWTPDGVAICTAIGARDNVRIAPDGTGGGIVSWLDQRVSFQVYAQRVDGTGATQWTTDGIQVSTASSNVPRITSDGSGGAVIGWTDARNGNNDVFAQRLDAAGNALWTAGGVTVAQAINNQTLTAVAGDGFGGTLLEWDDRRNGTTNRDPYAQRLGPEGSPPTGVGRTPAAIALKMLPAVPNPSSSEFVLRIDLPRASNVTLDVFDVGGRRVAHRDEKSLPSGWYELHFNGRDDASHILASGVYFARVTAGNASETQKLIVSR
jgi:hypothetical protein